jgi:hypothetical protein
VTVPEQRPAHVTPDDERKYIHGVNAEIKRLKEEAPYYQRWHQRARVAVIVTGGAVPVLTAWSAVPRPIIALAAAIAVAAVAETFQPQAHAVNMLHAANALERELDRLLYGFPPYTGPGRFTLFGDRVSSIRETADVATRQAWQRTATPLPGSQPESKPSPS